MITITTYLFGWVNVIVGLFGAALAGWYTWKLIGGSIVSTGISVLCGALMLRGLGFIIVFFRTDGLGTRYQSGPISWSIYHSTIRTVAGTLADIFLLLSRPILATN